MPTVIACIGYTVLFAENFLGKKGVSAVNAVLAGTGKLLIKHRRHIHHQKHYTISRSIFPVLFSEKSDKIRTITIESIEKDKAIPL